MNYLDKNRREMNKTYSDIKKFKEKFEITEDILKQLIEFGEESKIEFNEEQFNKSKVFLSLQLKALIAQNLFDTNEYFQVINDSLDTYRKALQIINNEEEYNRILKGG